MCGLHYGQVSVLIPMRIEAQGVSADAGPAGRGSDVKGTVPSHGFGVCLSLAGHGVVPVPAAPCVACGSAVTIPTPFPSALRRLSLPAFFYPLATCLGAHCVSELTSGRLGEPSTSQTHFSTGHRFQRTNSRHTNTPTRTRAGFQMPLTGTHCKKFVFLRVFLFVSAPLPDTRPSDY